MKVPASIERNQIGRRGTAAPGTYRKWFTEDPPPLPTRSRVDPQRLARHQDYERRGLPAFEADYVWNRYFLESQRCAEPNALERAEIRKAP